MSRVPDMPEKPTLADLAQHIVALHHCVHDGQQRLAEETRDLATELRDHRSDSSTRAARVNAQLADLKERVSYTEGALKIIGRVVGAPPPTKTGEEPKVRRRLATIEPWQAGLAFIAAVAAAGPGYKVLVLAVTALHGALMGAAG